jgi:hypothetical protein
MGFCGVAAHHALAAETMGDVGDRLFHHPAPTRRVVIEERQDDLIEPIIKRSGMASCVVAVVTDR